MALFNRQKADKPKKQESIIGKIIYGFLLFAPLLSIFVRCGYVILNKNAKDSYSDSQIYQQFVIQNTSQWVNDVVINLSYKNPSTTLQTNFTLKISYTSYSPEDLNITQAQYDTITELFFVNDGRIIFKNANNATVATQYWTTTSNFNIISTQTPNSYIFGIATVSRTILVQNKLDNVFEYSISQTEKSNLYNWAKSTGTYTVLETTCNGLGITNTFTPMLMAYWLLISIIYFLFDIALILIWAVHDKVHALKDAI